MSKQIWKYEFDPHSQTIPAGYHTSSLEVPQSAEFLSIGADPRGDICAWYLVEPAEKGRREDRFYLTGSGFDIPENILQTGRFLTTFSYFGLMIHAYKLDKFINRPDVSSTMREI